MTNRIRHLLTVSSIVLILSACGGGGGSADNPASVDNGTNPSNPDSENIASSSSSSSGSSGDPFSAPDIVKNYCQTLTTHPDWPQGDHANTGDIIAYENSAYEALSWTNSTPGSDSSWKIRFNCDGSPLSTVPNVPISNRKDPVSLKVSGWPSHLEVIASSSAANTVITLNAVQTTKPIDESILTSHYETLIDTLKSAGTASLIVNPGLLDEMIIDQGASMGTIPIKASLTQALSNKANTDISSSEINSLSDNAKGYTRSINLLISKIAPESTFGWELSLAGNFIHNNHSGRESIWNTASHLTADLLDQFELYSDNYGADFLAFSTNDSGPNSINSWQNSLEYVKQITDYLDKPALLWGLPADESLTDYFFGDDKADWQLRNAAHSNIFALLFESNISDITRYQSDKLPLYFTGSSANERPLTSINSLNTELTALQNTINNEVFVYQTDNGWVPSTIYKWQDFLDGLNAMHNVGVAGKTFWLMDDSADASTNSQYAKVAIAAFLAQAMQETVLYDACDENNWSKMSSGETVDYPLTAACGQLGQNYANYGFNPQTGRDDPYSCPRNPKMEVTAFTHATWTGAPAPLFAAPDAVLEEKGLLVDGNVGHWDTSVQCDARATEIDESKQVYDRDECETYIGQQAGRFVFDGSAQGSVEDCGWWGRGVIQTTGRQNFGTLNHYVGRSHVNPDNFGRTIDGVMVDAPPENPLYADLDLCANPSLVCTSEVNPELKWVAGLFFWMTSVQAYDNTGGPYADWNYYDQLRAYVDSGLVGNAFIDAVSGIVNRGCPDDHCSSGEVHAIEERRAHFKQVLEKMGLNPR